MYSGLSYPRSIPPPSSLELERVSRLQRLHLDRRRLAGEPLGERGRSDHESVVHRNRQARLHHLHEPSRLLRPHRVGVAPDADHRHVRPHAVELGHVVGVARVVVGDPAELEHVPHPVVGLRVRLQPALDDVVRGHGRVPHPADLARVPRRHRRDVARRYDPGRGGTEPLDLVRLVVIGVSVRDEDDVGRPVRLGCPPRVDEHGESAPPEAQRGLPEPREPLEHGDLPRVERRPVVWQIAALPREPAGGRSRARPVYDSVWAGGGGGGTSDPSAVEAEEGGTAVVEAGGAWPPGGPNDTDGAPGAKLTCGGPASRIVSGISKNSASLKWNIEAMTLDGNDWTRRLKSRTLPL